MKSSYDKSLNACRIDTREVVASSMFVNSETFSNLTDAYAASDASSNDLPSLNQAAVDS